MSQSQIHSVGRQHKRTIYSERQLRNGYLNVSLLHLLRFAQKAYSRLGKNETANVRSNLNKDRTEFGPKARSSSNRVIRYYEGAPCEVRDT